MSVEPEWSDHEEFAAEAGIDPEIVDLCGTVTVSLTIDVMSCHDGTWAVFLSDEEVFRGCSSRDAAVTKLGRHLESYNAPTTTAEPADDDIEGAPK